MPVNGIVFGGQPWVEPTPTVVVTAGLAVQVDLDWSVGGNLTVNVMEALGLQLQIGQTMKCVIIYPVEQTLRTWEMWRNDMGYGANYTGPFAPPAVSIGSMVYVTPIFGVDFAFG